MRIALGVEYDGRAFHGWQTQSVRPDRPATRSGVVPVVTVQGVLEEALSRIAAAPTRSHCAGRTDAGVHATGQVVHFDIASPRPQRAWLRGVNSYLPHGVRVVWARDVDDGFHARFSARSRSYCYLMLEQPEPPAIGRGQITHVRSSQPLDADAMQRAAQALVGEHDFTSFRAAGCQSRSPRRTLSSIQVRRSGRLLVLEVTANAFLLHMVRNIAGTLIGVGNGDRPDTWPAELLHLRDRTRAAATAPSDGLYLVQVGYPPEFGLPLSTGGPPLWLSASG